MQMMKLATGIENRLMEAKKLTEQAGVRSVLADLQRGSEPISG